MADVDERSTGAKFRAVCWQDEADIRRWFSALEGQVDELSAVARDRVRSKRARVLSRHEARRKVRAAVRAIAQLFAAAKAGFGPKDPFSPLPLIPDELERVEAPSSERRVMQPPSGGEGV